MKRMQDCLESCDPVAFNFVEDMLHLVWYGGIRAGSRRSPQSERQHERKTISCK